MENDLIRELFAEIQKAEARYGHFRSTHEALGVLLEEVAEFQDAVRVNDLESARREAMQIAAVALRFSNEHNEEFLERSVK